MADVSIAPAQSRDAGKTHARSSAEERRFGKGIAVGLPVLTLVLAGVVGISFGPPMVLLVLTGGTLLGVIAVFWASLRVLSGEVTLGGDLQGPEPPRSVLDTLGARKTMLVRALKDLDNERAIGKLEDEDYAQLSQTYRSELKGVLREIDATLEPHRAEAEALAASYLAKVRGHVPIAERTREGASEAEDELDHEDEDGAPRVPASTDDASPRIACGACAVSNDPDARFCKGCGGALEPLATKAAPSEEGPHP